MKTQNEMRVKTQKSSILYKICTFAEIANFEGEKSLVYPIFPGSILASLVSWFISSKISYSWFLLWVLPVPTYFMRCHLCVMFWYLRHEEVWRSGAGRLARPKVSPDPKWNLFYSIFRWACILDGFQLRNHKNNWAKEKSVHLKGKRVARWSQKSCH